MRIQKSCWKHSVMSHLLLLPLLLLFGQVIVLYDNYVVLQIREVRLEGESSGEDGQN